MSEEELARGVSLHVFRAGMDFSYYAGDLEKISRIMNAKISKQMFIYNYAVLSFWYTVLNCLLWDFNANRFKIHKNFNTSVHISEKKSHLSVSYTPMTKNGASGLQFWPTLLISHCTQTRHWFMHICTLGTLGLLTLVKYLLPDRYCSTND